MADSKESDEAYGEKEAARRRDAVLRRMLNTPPQPHTPKPKTRPASKGGVRKGKSRS